VGKFREGRHIDEFKDIVATKRCKTMQFVSDKPIDINLDGEIVPMKNPTIRIIDRAIKIILPKV
jgi:diacylglycerol kinase family enzyme